MAAGTSPEAQGYEALASGHGSGVRERKDIRRARVLIVSLKYSPGHAKEFILLAGKLREHGAEVRVFVSSEYSAYEFPDGVLATYAGPSTTPRDIARQFVRGTFGAAAKSLLESFKPQLMLYYNPHPLDPSLLRKARKQNPNILVGLFLHEPFKEGKLRYGVSGAIQQVLVERIQRTILAQADFALLPSAYAMAVFRERLSWATAEAHECHLLVPDSAGAPDSGIAPQYFSLVGMVNAATGLEDFLHLVRHCRDTRLPYRFQIVTSSDIGGVLQRQNAYELDNLRVTQGRRLTDDQIELAIRASHAVFRFDHEITQSGVIPLAFRASTPIIARDLPGLAQDVRDGSNGRLFARGASEADIVECLEWVLAHPESRAHARAAYLARFSPSVWDDEYRWLLTRLADDSRGLSHGA